MSWEFENKFAASQPFVDHGVPTGPDGDKTFGDPFPYIDTASIWGGRDLWVFISNTRYCELAAFNLWDQYNTDYEKLSYHYYFDNNEFPIRKVFGSKKELVDGKYTGKVIGAVQHTNPNGKISVTKWYDKAYVLHGDKDILTWDIQTYLPLDTIITMPEIVTSVSIKCDGTVENKEQQVAGSNVCAANNKLFVTTYNYTDDSTQQRLCIYDLETGLWDIKILPGRYQTQDRYIIDGLDGYIWITSKNNHSIIKVDVNTHDITATLRINRHPYRMSVNQSKELFVASDAGNNKVVRKEALSESSMISTGSGFITAGASYKIVTTEDPTDGMVSIVDQTTGAQDGYAAARCNGDVKDKDFFDDGAGRMWFVTDRHVGRLNKSDKELKCSFTKTEGGDTTKEPDTNMIPDNSEIIYTLPPDAIIQSAVVSPALHYQRWTNSAFEDVTVKPYLYTTYLSTGVDVEPETFTVDVGGREYTITLISATEEVPLGLPETQIYVREGESFGINTTIPNNDRLGRDYKITITDGTAISVANGGSDYSSNVIEFDYENMFNEPDLPAVWNPLTSTVTTTTSTASFSFRIQTRFDVVKSTLVIRADRISALVRKNKYEHRGTAMIAVGEQAYYGD